MRLLDVSPTMSANALPLVLLFCGATLVSAAPPFSFSAFAAGRQPQQPAITADLDKLPSSVVRVKRELARQTRETERFEDFRLFSTLTVYGQAPDIQVLAPSDFTVGAAPPYGGMTHGEFVNQVTPANFRAPVANVSGAAYSMFTALKKRREEQRTRERAKQYEEQWRTVKPSEKSKEEEKPKEEKPKPDGQR